jgi:diguanylate cyclase (GGDEF)-like protein
MGYRLEVDLICIILMQWIIRRLLKDKDERKSQRSFLYLVYSLSVTCAADAFCALVEGTMGHGWYILNQVLTCLFICMMVITSYMWLVYSTTFTRSKKLLNQDNIWGYRVPLFAALILTILSPWGGIIYTVSKATNYATAGYLSFVIFIVPGFYIVMAAVQLIIAFIYDPETKTVLSLETIILFIALPIFTLLLTLLFDTVSTTIPAFSLILAAVCFDIQIGHISTDGLTGLNNKRQFLQFINSCLTEPPGPLKTYLFMIDLDYFKHINDEYGHNEGDNALIEVAELLKGICCGSQGMFLARYGGDEFVFVIKSRFSEEIINLKRDIIKAINERNERTTKKYKLSVSIGYAVYENGVDTLESLTAKADDMLYKEKEQHHAEIDKDTAKDKR